MPGTRPIEIAVQTETDPDVLASRPGRRRRRRLRKVTRALRSRRGKQVLAVLACVAVILGGLLIEGFLSSPAPSVAAPVDQSVTSASAQPGASKAPHKKAATKASSIETDPVGVLRSAFPYNPLNHLRAHGVHDVVVSATSAGPIAVLGYLVPTGLGKSYGGVDNHPRHWSMSERAVGSGYLAAIFLQAGKSGAPVTCTITIDGKVTDRQTTSGSYGRAVCLG